MSFIYNKPLKSLNTFGIDAKAAQFAAFDSVNALVDLLKQVPANANLLILGGGSNLLFTRDFEGIVLKNEITGLELVNETPDHYFLKAGAGEVWHKLVMHCVDKNYQGIENLALIPGCVGAAPMQNIGAYGVELKDLFHELEAVEIASGNIQKFDLKACAFGYRESVFKNELKNKFVITSVTLRLNKKPVYNTSYGHIAAQLEADGVTQPTMRAIANAVIAIRSSKLPDPAQIGNAGSFFKNPEIDAEQFNALKIEYPNIVGYEIGHAKMKVAAGWLIEQAGWKGKTFDNYGVHKNQALVLVNYGNAKGQNILDLSQKIIDSIYSQFGIKLVREVNIY
ncbi:MAG TPA: UDP-N-acetylmuramate dehydrogenase [Flavobacteriales bacterium]|nr:UDP-N-acetylmuramate dehydrogenase [Flavobacteriales bacterium]